ncbi:MAG: hypothetical protein H6Q76_1907 [Firmicutes bacterium]|nr:hypothetical protein [Bacillota bacterium]
MQWKRQKPGYTDEFPPFDSLQYIQHDGGCLLKTGCEIIESQTLWSVESIQTNL